MYETAKRRFAVILALLPFLACVSGCRTIPTPTQTDRVITVIEKQAGEVITQTVEIEKTVDRIITLTDGEAKKEAVKLAGQVKTLKTNEVQLVGSIDELKVEVKKQGIELTRLYKIETNYEKVKSARNWLICYALMTSLALLIVSFGIMSGRLR